jgi:peroxiredoxin (alkyl hydroperoxide reductase subunit C)
MSMVGQKAPEWKATAYINGEQKEISSEDLRGRWHVLYWYPLDFTFVCPTEIRGFQALLKDFEAEGVSVIGASTDSYFSHNAWFADREIFPNEITHPVVADTAHEVSKAFGVLKEDAGIALRATVIVDDKGVIRSYAVNDTQVGRSPAEVLRTAQAFQSGGLCGVDWHKGESFVA